MSQKILDNFIAISYCLYMADIPGSGADTKKKPDGNTSTYNPDVHCNMAIVAGKAGMTDVEFAEVIGISRATLNVWRKNFPEFKKAFKGGKKYADDKVVESLFEKANGWVDNDNVELFHYKGEVIEHKIPKRYPPDTTAQIFWLKNRMPKEWRDRHDINVTNDIDYKEQRSKLQKIFKKENK